MTRNYSELPQDLLLLLMKRMAATVEDMICCGSVCRSWQAAVLAAAAECPKTAPFLLIQEKGSPNLTPFSPSYERCYKLDRPKALPEDVRIVGSSHGWLAASDDRENVSLINLLTGASVALPPLPLDEYPVVEGWASLKFRKIVWSSCPTSSSCAAMAICEGNSYFLAVTEPGDWSWQISQLSWCSPDERIDIVHFNDRFYLISNRVLLECQLRLDPSKLTASVMASIPEVHMKSEKYFVQMFGKLLLVVLPSSCLIESLGRNFAVYEIKERKLVPEPVTSLGGGRIFLSETTSCADSEPQREGCKNSLSRMYFCDHNSLPATLIQYCLDDGKVRDLCERIECWNLTWAAWVELNVAQLLNH